MGITQIGAKLFRTFSSGTNSMKVVTEFKNGKTYTRVFDDASDIVKSRVKQIVSGQQVGNKKVNTITKVTNEVCEGTTKSVTDRVYSKGGEFLGSRKALFRPLLDLEMGKISVTKHRVRGKTFEKRFFMGKLKHKYYYDDLIPYEVLYNKKGLPYPAWMTTGDRLDFANASIKEMQEWRLKKGSGPYVEHAGSGLGFLNINEYDFTKLYKKGLTTKDFLNLDTKGFYDLDKYI